MTGRRPQWWAVDLNAWFDRLPRLYLDVGTRRVPAFRSLGLVGYQLAVVVAVLAGLLNGTPLITTLGVAAVSCLSFFGWAVARRAMARRETLVLLEYVWVALVTLIGFLWASGRPIAPALDVFAVAVTPFLAVGRLGCLTVGCCHGIPARVGVRYGQAHGLPDRLTGVRLLPVPLFESVGLIVIGAVGLGLVGRQPGTATVWFLASYAIVRFGLERLRGDWRPSVAWLPVARAACVVQLLAAVVASEAWLVPGPPRRAVVVGLVALAVAALAGVALRRRRQRDSLADFRHLNETWECIRDLARLGPGTTQPETDHTTRGMFVAVSHAGPGRLHVSLSHPALSVFDVGLGLAPEAIEQRQNITHIVLAHEGRRASGDTAERRSYFEAPSRRDPLVGTAAVAGRPS